MISKTGYVKWWLLVACQVLIVFLVAAQPPGGGGGGGGLAEAPIDGGAVGLLAAIAGYGYRSLKVKEKVINQ